MTFPKTIFTDIDGVVLDWNAAFHEYMGEKGYEIDTFDATSYNVALRYDITKKEKKALVDEFNGGPWMEKLVPFRGSKPAIQNLRRIGYEFVAITSQTADVRGMMHRRNNLVHHFGLDAFKEIVILPTGETKYHILKHFAEHHPGALWLEDKRENAMDGMTHGFHSVLFRHEYNKHLETDGVFRSEVGDIPVVHGWGDVIEILS